MAQKKTIKRKNERMVRLTDSIQFRLMALLAVMLLIILLLNLYIYTQSRSMMRRIDRVFASNVSIVELMDKLSQVEENVYEYLSTRSSASLENFYRYSQEYENLTQALSDTITDDQSLMLERDIRHMSVTYLELAGEAVQAKRGRNIEEYRELYEEAGKVRDYIGTYVYELNALRFEQNSQSYQRLLQVYSRLERFSLILILFVFAVTLIIAGTLIHAMISPLGALARAAYQVADGNFEVEIPPTKSRSEVGIVTTAFRRMVVSIKEYILKQRTSLENEARMKENELAMEAHLKDAQLKYLQAQINPHFLFNSLNAASQLAMLEGAERSEDYLGRMADFFRYNVKKSDGRATLSEEIGAVDNYIYILNVRFGGDIRYEKEIDPSLDLESYIMPSMILQPIMENAINHGIHDDREHGRITLAVERVDAEDNEVGCDCIRVSVADNGAGMTRTQLDAVMNRTVSKERRDDGGSTGIALENVMSRLELFYGREHLFSIWSDGPGCGTEVNILLPCEETKPAEDEILSPAELRGTAEKNENETAEV